jgi:Flp pilus assembly protein TadG
MSPHSRRRGAAAVEFALTLPILLAVGSAVLDYAWYLNQAADVLSAVREGTRYGATIAQDDDPTVVAVARTHVALANYNLSCSDPACVEASLGEVEGMTTVEVRAEITYTPVIGLVPTPATMGASLVMVLEDQTES